MNKLLATKTLFCFSVAANAKTNVYGSQKEPEFNLRLIKGEYHERAEFIS